MKDVPNVLWIMADQHHAGCMSWCGHEEVRTPNIDRIANGGVAFTNAFSPCGICTPARISYESGLYVHQHGQYHNWGDVRETDTVSRRLRDNGYRTATVGKQHYLPYWNSHGFDYVRPTDIVDTLDDPMDNAYWAHLKRHGLEREHEHSMRYHSRHFEMYESVLPAEHSVETVTANEALSFLESCTDEQPFFLHLSFNRPHPPYAPPPEYLHRHDPAKIKLPEVDVDWDTKPEWQKKTMEHDTGPHPFALMDEPTLRKCVAYYYDLIELIDDEIGRVLKYLDDNDMIENTIIVYCADHGDHAGEHGIVLKPFSTLDSILHIPFLFNWPGHVPQGEKRDQLVEAIDLFPTLCDLAGLEMPQTPGISLVPIMNDPDAVGKDAVFSETRQHRTVRTAVWKYSDSNKGDDPELYDLKADPGEGHNLAAMPDMASRVKEMKDRLNRWEHDTQPYFERDLSTLAPFDPNYPRNEGWRILAGEWWSESQRI